MLAAATILEAIQFTVSILTRFVLRTWSSLPPRGTLEPHRSLKPLSKSADDDDIEVNVKEGESEILVSISSPLIGLSAILLPFANEPFLFQTKGKATSSNAKRPYASHSKVSRSDVRNLLFRSECTWALENTAKICNHFRLRALWPHPRVNLAQEIEISVAIDHLAICRVSFLTTNTCLDWS